jgi:hypothetical protein
MTKSNFGTVLAFVAGVLITYLIIDSIKKSNVISDLQKQIDENEDLNKEIKSKLTELIQNNKDVYPDVANELAQIVALLEVKQDNSAILKLTKVIENLLKTLYKGDSELKDLAKHYGRKSPVFADYLEHAKNKNVITTEDFHLLSLMKSMRNDEAHELAVHKHKSKIFAAFIAGIGLVLGLCQMLNRKSIEPDNRGISA